MAKFNQIFQTTLTGQTLQNQDCEEGLFLKLEELNSSFDGKTQLNDTLEKSDQISKTQISNNSPRTLVSYYCGGNSNTKEIQQADLIEKLRAKQNTCSPQQKNLYNISAQTESSTIMSKNIPNFPIKDLQILQKKLQMPCLEDFSLNQTALNTTFTTGFCQRNIQTSQYNQRGSQYHSFHYKVKDESSVGSPSPLNQTLRETPILQKIEQHATTLTEKDQQLNRENRKPNLIHINELVSNMADSRKFHDKPVSTVFKNSQIQIVNQKILLDKSSLDTIQTAIDQRTQFHNIQNETLNLEVTQQDSQLEPISVGKKPATSQAFRDQTNFTQRLVQPELLDSGPVFSRRKSYYLSDEENDQTTQRTSEKVDDVSSQKVNQEQFIQISNQTEQDIKDNLLSKLINVQKTRKKQNRNNSHLKSIRNNITQLTHEQELLNIMPEQKQNHYIINKKNGDVQQIILKNSHISQDLHFVQSPISTNEVDRQFQTKTDMIYSSPNKSYTNQKPPISNTLSSDQQ